MAKTSLDTEKRWMMDDTISYDPDLLKDVIIPPELQAKIDAIFDDKPTPIEAPTAA